MSTFRIPLAKEFDGVGKFTGAGLAAFLGISLRDVLDLIEDLNVDNLPLEWKQTARQRAGEAQAHSGSENPVDTLSYWAVKQWGDRVTVTHDTQAAELWLTTDDPEVADWFLVGKGGGG